jgi:hypothetical protein
MTVLEMEKDVFMDIGANLFNKYFKFSKVKLLNFNYWFLIRG